MSSRSTSSSSSASSVFNGAVPFGDFIFDVQCSGPSNPSFLTVFRAPRRPRRLILAMCKKPWFLRGFGLQGGEKNGKVGHLEGLFNLGLAS